MLYNLSNFNAVQFLFRQHVDLIGFLDYEIWKVSHMLAQNIPDIPLSGPSESKGKEFPTTEEWKDFDHKWETNETA